MFFAHFFDFFVSQIKITAKNNFFIIIRKEIENQFELLNSVFAVLKIYFDENKESQKLLPEP